MNSSIISLILALAAPSATVVAFSPSPAVRPSASSSSKLNSLRDIASFPDSQRMMSEFEAFDRNGAFSRSPQGGMGGRQDMMSGVGGGGGMMNPFSRRDDHRMYTRDGFDPYSAYGNTFGMSQSDRRNMMGPGGPMVGGMEMGGGYYGGSDMMNGVRNDNTMGGFSYSSRVRGYGQGRPFEPQYDYEMFDGPGPMGGGGMEYGPERGYGGFEGDLSRMGP